VRAVRLQPLVALTVDAEPPDRRRCAPGNGERILEALDEAGIRATFPSNTRPPRPPPLPGGRAVDTPTAGRGQVLAP
jgi:hypothetical protein